MELTSAVEPALLTPRCARDGSRSAQMLDNGSWYRLGVTPAGLAVNLGLQAIGSVNPGSLIRSKDSSAGDRCQHRKCKHTGDNQKIKNIVYRYHERREPNVFI